MRFEDYKNEALKDPALKREYDAWQGYFDDIQRKIDERRLKEKFPNKYFCKKKQLRRAKSR